jgi:uncharacterized protein YacL
MNKLLHGFVCLVCTLLGVTLAFAINREVQEAIAELVGADPRTVLVVILGGIGYLVGATFSFEFHRWLEDVLPRVQVRDVVWGGVGAASGMLLANLAVLPLVVLLNVGQISVFLHGTSLGKLVVPVGSILVPVSLNLFLGYLGATFLLRKQGELEGILSGEKKNEGGENYLRKRFLLDTSAIIDGRVLDLVVLGLLDGIITVPRFVIDELQLLGDSSDESKRGRGQRGLEILEKIKEVAPEGLLLPDQDFKEIAHVDEKLLRFARLQPTVLVTNDYNLSKLATLEAIETLSLHALADVMRPVALPGERLDVEVVKKGKEKGQGIGYLADGTMVVIREAGERKGQRLGVVIERVLQTSAGRMLFAHPEGGTPLLQSLPPAEES